MAKVKAKLRDLSLRGDTVNTRWGAVSFDKDGLAELEVDEDDLPMLRDTKPHPWLVEEAPVEAPKSKGKDAGSDEDDDKDPKTKHDHKNDKHGKK
jgi:hypothetical protein